MPMAYIILSGFIIAWQYNLLSPPSYVFFIILIMFVRHESSFIRLSFFVHILYVPFWFQKSRPTFVCVTSRWYIQKPIKSTICLDRYHTLTWPRFIMPVFCLKLDISQKYPYIPTWVWMHIKIKYCFKN